MSTIVHVVHAWNGRTIAQVAGAVAGRMAGHGHDVIIVAASEEDGDPAPPGVSLVLLGGTGRRTITTVPAVRRILRRLRPDLVFAHGNGPIRAAVIAVAGWSDGLRLVGVEHNHYSSYPWSLKPLRDRLNATLLPRLDVLAGVSPGVVDDLACSFPRVRDRLVVLPPPLVRYEQLGAMAAEPVDHPWFEGEVPVIVTVGHVHARKDHVTLVRAMAHLRDRAGPRAARAVIIGSDVGPEADRVRAEIASLELGDVVELLGSDPNPIRFVARADVFALSSRNEGMPVVLLEALAVGSPVVSTDCPSGPSWILEEGRRGGLVPVGDPVAFGDALLTLLDDPDRRASLARWGRQRAADFAPAAIADTYLDAAGAPTEQEFDR